MEVTLLGTGDTTGTPTVGCDCETCERARRPGEALQNRLRERGATITGDGGIERSRFSVHVCNPRTDEALLVDFSPDFRQQFLREDLPPPDAGVITHIHFDHLDGLGNCYRITDHLDVHAADVTDPETGESVAETVAGDYDYLERLSVHAQSPLEPFDVCGLEVTLVPVEHPPLLCYGLVVVDPETGAQLSVTGDTHFGIPQQSRSRLADADLLLADAIVPAALCEYHPLGGDHFNEDGVSRTFGGKHMTLEGALDLADELDAAETRLVHAAHYYPVEEAFVDPLAVDGESYEL